MVVNQYTKISTIYFVFKEGAVKGTLLLFKKGRTNNLTFSISIKTSWISTNQCWALFLSWHSLETVASLQIKGNNNNLILINLSVFNQYCLNCLCISWSCGQKPSSSSQSALLITPCWLYKTSRPAGVWIFMTSSTPEQFSTHWITNDIKQYPSCK